MFGICSLMDSYHDIYQSTKTLHNIAHLELCKICTSLKWITVIIISGDKHKCHSFNTYFSLWLNIHFIFVVNNWVIDIILHWYFHIHRYLNYIIWFQTWRKMLWWQINAYIFYLNALLQNFGFYKEFIIDAVKDYCF